MSLPMTSSSHRNSEACRRNPAPAAGGLCTQAPLYAAKPGDTRRSQACRRVQHYRERCPGGIPSPVQRYRLPVQGHLSSHRVRKDPTWGSGEPPRNRNSGNGAVSYRCSDLPVRLGPHITCCIHPFDICLHFPVCYQVPPLILRQAGVKTA